MSVGPDAILVVLGTIVFIKFSIALPFLIFNMKFIVISQILSGNVSQKAFKSMSFIFDKVPLGKNISENLSCSNFLTAWHILLGC